MVGCNLATLSNFEEFARISGWNGTRVVRKKEEEEIFTPSSPQGRVTVHMYLLNTFVVPCFPNKLCTIDPIDNITKVELVTRIVNVYEKYYKIRPCKM